MNQAQHGQYVTELNHLIADQLEDYLDKHPDLPASVVLTALGEAMVNLGAQKMGYDYIITLCQQLQEAVEQASH